MKIIIIRDSQTRKEVLSIGLGEVGINKYDNK